MSQRPTIAIIGAGPAGLMAADYLTQFDVNIEVYEQMPSAARKFLMAGKTGLNLSHAEDLQLFIQRYQPSEWLAPYIKKYNAQWIQNWAKSLGIQTYVGSSGRIFPVEMKAAPLLRAWLNDLKQKNVTFFYRHRCIDIQQNQVTFAYPFHTDNKKTPTLQNKAFSAIILACGAVSWQKLGSDGFWQQWFNPEHLTPFFASNVGIQRTWSSFMQPFFGQALKRVYASVLHDNQPVSIYGDIMLSAYGMEGGSIYQLNQALKAQFDQHNIATLVLDLLPDLTLQQLENKLTQASKNKKQSLNNIWRKVGLDQVKIALLRECVNDKSLWHNHQIMAQNIKKLTLTFSHFRPIDEAISCGGGIKSNALKQFQYIDNPFLFCCGEMLDWNAPTGGYLLTACFATGRAAAENITSTLRLEKIRE